MKRKAFLFDLNGTMVNDMEYHLEAWFDIINNDLKANIPREDVKKEMYGKNAEVLVRVFGEGKFSIEKMNEISEEKEKRYKKAYLPDLKLIAGLDEFLKAAKSKQIKMAIASAAIQSNIDFVVDNLKITNFFAAMVSADDVEKSKPDPETFLKAAERIHAEPKDCIVFEDAPKGVEAASNAGMPAVVLTTMHEKEDFAQYSNILAFIKDYTDPFVKELLNQ